MRDVVVLAIIITMIVQCGTSVEPPSCQPLKPIREFELVETHCGGHTPARLDSEGEPLGGEGCRILARTAGDDCNEQGIAFLCERPLASIVPVRRWVASTIDFDKFWYETFAEQWAGCGVTFLVF